MLKISHLIHYFLQLLHWINIITSISLILNLEALQNSLSKENKNILKFLGYIEEGSFDMLQLMIVMLLLNILTTSVKLSFTLIILRKLSIKLHFLRFINQCPEGGYINVEEESIYDVETEDEEIIGQEEVEDQNEVIEIVIHTQNDGDEVEVINHDNDQEEVEDKNDVAECPEGEYINVEE